MAYGSSPAARLFEGPDKNINIVTAVSLVNALIIFAGLYYYELEEKAILEFFITWRTLALAVAAYYFRTGKKRDFGKFICVLNVIAAIYANYLTYNGDINDSGWDAVDEIITTIQEKLEDDSDDSSKINTPQPQTQPIQQPERSVNLLNGGLKNAINNSQQPQPVQAPNQLQYEQSQQNEQLQRQRKAQQKLREYQQQVQPQQPSAPPQEPQRPLRQGLRIGGE